MNRRLLLVAAVAFCLTAHAQYIIMNDELPILASDVEKITYEEDDEFESTLLPSCLASDSRTQLFSQALQLTGLADTLRNYVYADYDGSNLPKYYYRAHVRSEVASYNATRYKKYTVFAETDDVFAANGINNLDQLKAYAKQVYDATFPEDASVTDPTDRRNSLNRFVAYHILCHGSSYWYLTYYDGEMTDMFVNTRLTDVSTWYRTLMPEASLKCSYPKIGDESGVYLNHRGLRNGPDKYGKQVRGAKVVADGEQDFDHKCFNGYYFYIDRILAYDQTTRDEVLGSELWRVDFKTLSSDIMNNADELRGNYLKDDGLNGPADDSDFPENGRNYIYKWDCMENVKGDVTKSSAGLIARRAHAEFWSWQGDEVNIIGDFDMTIKLPPLPPGEWEVRMGTCPLETRPYVRIYLNGEVTIDTLDMRKTYNDADMYFSELSIQTEVLDYMAANVFVVEQTEERKFLVTDMITGEKMLMNQDPYMKNYDRYQGILAQNDIRNFAGEDPTTSNHVNWDERATAYRNQTVKDVIASMPKIMKGPQECTSFGNGSQYSFSETNYIVRYPLGRIVSNGKSDNYLRIEMIRKSNGQGNGNQAMFDYFELVPKFVYDNQEIPEE